MEIPLNASVECTDGVFGRSIYVLINPVTDKVTHVVVKADASPNTEYTVPVDVVVETTKELIRLRCSVAEVEKMEGFISTTYIQERVPDNQVYGYAGGMYGAGSYYYLPYVTSSRTVFEKVENRKIPAGELAFHRGTRVEATDGFVGKVDEFVVDRESSEITDLVMREGHLWGKKDVIISIAEIQETRNDTVFLKLNKHEIDSLPIYPLHRRWSN